MTLAADGAGKDGDGLPLYELIYRVLRRHLADGALPKGLVIGEAAVARAFRSSRIPAAAALRRLRDEGLLTSFEGRGLIVEGGEEPLRIDLAEAGLVLPETLGGEPKARNRRVRIYPEVEHIVASCLPYGRFQLNGSLLADHYGVSRTVAHEVLTRLERAGLIVQDRNQRWYAGPLTPELMQEHFELRWLLEPVALTQAPDIDRVDLEAKRARLVKLQTGKRTVAAIERLEEDLHVDTVLRCRNRQLRQAIRRSQLPLIATHHTFERHLHTEEVDLMLAEHREVFDRLIAADLPGATAALERHLRRSFTSNVALLAALGPLPERHRVPFLIEVG
ncbi:GntR family transcriptional regulator [Prosthecomicrobium pneumaticum]|uniref:DNA-binding GntR family transcriptional regulator n=1 Tax=Prosthecomicrobium pneumaticum TaxID=81895 RepID=A0A7W9CSN1_9HYPH|nr:GntR family transcriptional regulator [Prosthecomicrobium pneumaticum]MBB5751178.1 DNA-binding GntR family transcriptional regulator [Prosthecomicrobium pneumaticum]